MCENLGAVQQISPVTRFSDEHKKHMPSDDPWLAYGAFGPPRRFAAAQKDGRAWTYRVAALGLRRKRSVLEALRESSERCSSPPLIHNSRRAGAQHLCCNLCSWLAGPAVRRSNLLSQ